MTTYCKVEFLVKDEDVGRALRSLVGVAFDLTAVPVVNMRRGDDGTVVPETSGTLSDLFQAHIRRARPSRVDRAYIEDWLVSIGREPRSANHVVRTSKSFLRRHGRGRAAWYEPKVSST